ncbi:MAG TPA: DUF1294 domain-containing protein [Candidatus Didemnitutus sp.]|jgi:uncharacterized membrane protein YsdA (DUF1294 family)
MKAGQLLFPVLLALPAMAAWQLFGREGLAVAGAGCAILSVLALVLYALDKRRARTQGPREPESSLHLVELLGGWPGAFFAQQWFRHKTIKRSYQLTYWTIVALHQLVSADALLGWPVSRTAIRMVRDLAH